jgi:hypothetical protein
MQESKLRNLDYGDRDSLGLFQQRPSQAWGTPEQIMDPVYSAGEFYKELAKVPDYETAPITEAAQAVQRSAYPEAYAQHENAARSFASALTGHSPGGLTCTLGPAAEASDPALFIATFQAEWGDSAGGGITTTADAARPGGDGTASGPAVTLRAGSSTEGWAYAQWAVAKARQLGVAAVEADGQVWDRADTSWQPTSSPAAGDPGTGQLVTVHLVSLPTDPP